MDLEAMQAALTELADREAIRQCLTNYARAVDRNDRALLERVYHPDAIDDHGVFIGARDEFIDWWFTQADQHLSCQHCVYNMTIELEGEVAHTETYYMFVGMEATGTPFIMSGGRYIDRLEKREGHWAIAARKCIRDWVPRTERPASIDQSSLTSGGGFLGEREMALLSTCSQATRDARDPSYERPLVVDPARLEHWSALGEQRAATTASPGA